MSNKEPRPVNDHHIANLDRHIDKVVQQLQANEWKLLSTPDIEPYALKELFVEQVELEKLVNWVANIKMRLRPPTIVNPHGAGNGMKLVN